MFSRNGKATDNAYLPIVKLKQMQRVVSNRAVDQKVQVQPERQMVGANVLSLVECIRNRGAFQIDERVNER
jgi:hypothetical protein